MKSPKVMVIVLNWNGGDDTLACLASLGQLRYPASEVVVVDNGSTDDSVAAIRSAYPQVKLIEMGDNLGYVGGNNVGLEYAEATGADYALLLNNDTVVAPDLIRRLVEAAMVDPTVGIAGPTIYYYDQPEVIWSAGGSIDWVRGSTRMLGLGDVDRGQLGEIVRPVSFVTGCALLIKMPVVKRIGRLDPRFFAYYEETEWCVRAGRAGYKILHVPQAKVWHKIALSRQEASFHVAYYMTRNQLLFLKLARAGLVPWLYTLFLNYGRTLLSYTLRPKWRHKALQRRAMIQAILDYGQGRFGRMSATALG